MDWVPFWIVVVVCITIYSCFDRWLSFIENMKEIDDGYDKKTVGSYERIENQANADYL